MNVSMTRRQWYMIVDKLEKEKEEEIKSMEMHDKYPDDEYWEKEAERAKARIRELDIMLDAMYGGE